MQYAHVTDGTVDRTGLPETGALADGRSVSRYHNLPKKTLKAEGWLPLTDKPPKYDSDTQHLVVDGYDVTSAKVSVRYRIETHPSADLPSP